MSNEKEELRLLHNRLVNQFIRGAVKEILVRGGDWVDLSIMLESLIMGYMAVATKQFKMPPQIASSAVEMAVDAALERFIKMNEEKKL